MSKYSISIDGEMIDFQYKKYGNQKGCYYFYLGNNVLGIVSKIYKSWTAVPHIKKYDIGLVQGFRTRLDACEYLIQYMRLGDYYIQQDKEREAVKRLYSTTMKDKS